MTSRSSSAPLSLETAQEFLREQAQRIQIDPMTNSVFALSQTLFRSLEAGETSLADLSKFAGEVHLDLIEQRADRFRAQHCGGNDTAAWKLLEGRLEELAGEGFDAFKAAVEQPRGGIVFTGHPTFALSSELRTAFAAHVGHPTKSSRATLAKLVRQDSRVWNQQISLHGEHEEAQAAIVHAAGAQRKVSAVILKVARRAFPDQWRSLRPALPTLASWVGYDLDGRADIHWSQSLTFRLCEKAEQLERYADRADEINAIVGKSPALNALSKRLRAACKETRRHADLFATDLTNADNLVAAANALTAHSEHAIRSATDITDAVDRALPSAEDDLAEALIAFRAEAEAQQLGTARIHLRVNAAQVRTVINRDLGLETEDRELGRVALAELAEKARKSKPVKVNFGDLFLEQSTARRQFMMCAQILKHIDSGSVIRFLIAESENPATVMGALYLARQYGVEDMLDISPLFETPEALETGGRFVERLLEEPEFLAYVKARGYLSIQLGFSDAGRFIGQVAADMAIERIHNLIARALAAKEAGVDLLIFNTHGESMGRGAWPGTFKQRFDHLLTPWTRGGAKMRGLKLRHEVSFQGGDGYLHFATPMLASATMAAWCQHIFEPVEESRADPFYTRTDLVWDFYRALRAWHERLFGNADYGRLLGAFSSGLTVKAGSRPKRRAAGPAGPRSLRAISHNATLQQLGVPVNTAAGIGSSLQRETERLVQLIDASPRMRHLIELAQHARDLTSLPALRAYARVYDPSVWIAHARLMTTDTAAAAYRAVYYSLRTDETAISIDRIANMMTVDLRRFDRLMAQTKDAPSTEQRHEERLTLHVLHAIRQTLIMRAFAIVGGLPRLSERHDASTRDVVRMVSELRIGEVVDLLSEIFPRARDEGTPLASLTESGGDVRGTAYGYDRIHRDIIAPLNEIDRTLHGISLAITHPYGAFG
ncbi:MAG: phosphoenolpyruvate carboxylase [Hyphomonas sp.]|uniref:phosphoenolpyruvate carboxylase n=1 Tax=Hyphomonas sp. TaxID=87 RepID=UPI00352771A5